MRAPRQIPADFPNRDRVWRPHEDNDQWVEEGNSIIVDPDGTVLARLVRHEETILTVEIELSAVHAARRYFDPVGHYNRPDIFHLNVDTRSRPAVRTE